jgi:hypothetical protein
MADSLWGKNEGHIAEENFAPLEKAGIVLRSTSPWASLLHMVPKKDGSWQLCGDYRWLNTITVHDRYPLPNMMDLSTNMEGCTIFTKIDLVKAFQQEPIKIEIEIDIFISSIA